MKQSSKDDTISSLCARVSSVAITLPSSLPRKILHDESLATAIRLERKERQDRARFRLDQLRGHLITSFRRKRTKSTAKGQKLSTRTQGAIKRKQQDINHSATFYREARSAMLALGMPNDDKEFRPLLSGDLRAYDTTALEDILSQARAGKHKQVSKAEKKILREEDRVAQRAMLGDRHISWIWENWSFIQSGNLSDNVRT